MLIHKQTSNKKVWIGIGIAGILCIGAIVSYSFLNAKHQSAMPIDTTKPYDATTFNSDTNVPVSSNDPHANAVASDKDSDGTQSTPAPADGTTPDAPSGAFVSNEDVTLSGDRSQVNSVCTTTPGASCTIIFTKNGVVRQLPAKVADSTGHATWSWNVGDSSINLSTGTWTISATATIGSKSATATYPIELKVSA